MQRLIKVFCFFFFAALFCCPSQGYAGESRSTHIQIPDYVVNMEKDNTYDSHTVHTKKVKPNKMSKQILETSPIPIENPYLIQLLNESTMKNAPLAVGYYAKIYLGIWPLNYVSKDTNVNWYYQKINTNYMDNRDGKQTARMSYYQETQKTVKGGLTSYLNRVEDVQAMILQETRKRTALPLSFEATIGGATRGSGLYHVPAKCMGYLSAYVPAIHEEGEVTYGAVYLDLKGNKRTLLIEKMKKEEINAWVPIQDYIAFGFDYKSMS